MNNVDIAKEWINMSLIDFDSAVFLLNMEPKPLEIICYHSQQCVEKLLKGFIALNGGEILKTHDLVTLNKICIGCNTSFTEINNECIELTDYSVQIRYPFHIDLVDEDAISAIDNAKKVFDFLRAVIKNFELPER